MQFTRQDEDHCENLIKALKRAEFKLEGMEVLAMSDVFKWVNTLKTRITSDLAAQAALVTAKEVQSPITSDETAPTE